MLDDRYAAPVAPRVSPADAFARARQIVAAGDKLDMAALASDVGVARATLYRWAGDREQLLAEVVWAALSGLLDALRAGRRLRGLALIQAVASDYLAAVAASPAMQAFMRHEGDAGLRLVTAPSGLVRPRLVARIAELIQAEVDAGHYAPPAAPELLADGIVSLGERFLHHGGDPELNPDPGRARQVIGLILREA